MSSVMVARPKLGQSGSIPQHIFFNLKTIYGYIKIKLKN